MEETLYCLNSIQKIYGQRLALDIDRLEVQPGRLYILTGANGAGKSTLLGILAFLIQPTSGDLSFESERVTWDSSAIIRMRRQVTLLHQTPYLFSGTVAHNVAFGLKVRGITGKNKERLVSDALHMVGLSGFETRKVRELSGGEAQRVALARALALRPKVLLLDEPMANLDKETAELFGCVIASLPEMGTSVIMTTHNPEQCDRLPGGPIHLVGGRINLPTTNPENRGE
ncbi:MAG: ATP-binding cassette domain-containing protein [Geobacteraceae bacterium]